MAVQGRGYYGIGAAKKDFGFTKNMSLPLNRQYEWPSTDGTPMEGGSKKKGRATFAEDDGHRSWKKRFSSLFKKNKKRERQEALNQKTTGVVSGYRTEPTQSQPVRNTEPADDVNDRILMQQGLTEEQSENSEIDDEAVLGEGESDSGASMVVAEEVEVVYLEDEDNSLGGAHAEKDINAEEDEPQTTVEVEAELHNEATPPEAPLEEKEHSDDQIESKPRVRASSKSKKNGKAAKRKSAALESMLQDEETGERKKPKKRRPKSMPPQSIHMTEDQDDKPLVESPKAKKERAETKQPAEDTAAQVASIKKKKRPKMADTSTSEGKMVETEQEVKKVKAKRSKEKRQSATNDTEEKESSGEVVEFASPPPEEEIRVPKQVTVGVIKKKKQKTRPFLDISHEGEDYIDTEERKLIHDMDTLQLIADGESATTNDKKVKKKKQGKAYVTQEQEPAHEQPSEITKPAKKSKRRSTAESKAAALEETKEAKVSKKAKSEDKAEVEAVVAPPQLETATEQDTQRKRKAKKTKGKENSEPEAEPVVVQPPPQMEDTKETKKKKTTGAKKKGKSKQGEASPLIQPEVMTEPDKKPSKKAKKTKGSEKGAPAPVTTPGETPEASKKKSSKKSKGKGKVAEDMESPSPTTDKAKKKKRKSSKASIGSEDSSLVKQTPSGSASARTSRSLLGSRSSKSKIASEESDDLVWIGSEKLPKKKKPRAESKDDTAAGEADKTELSPGSRSTSYHELSKEARKTLQEEFRKASSQQSIDASDTKVDIDPNVKVTKSGVVKGGKGSRRPSIQVFEESGMDHTDNASPSEDTGDSGGRGKKISMDLAAIPQTTPSLGLTHGHDKLDLVNRSASKRRPMSFSHKDSSVVQEEAKSVDSPPQNHILAAHISKLNRISGASNGSSPQDSASLVYKAAMAKNRQSAPIARQLFPSGESQNGEGSATSTLERSKRNKSVDKPVKTLGIASENSPASGSASPSSVPAWVALAQNKQKRSSFLLADKEDNKPAASMTSPPSAAAAHTTTTTAVTAGSVVGGSRIRQSDSTIPKMGTVQARLAAFERK